jgi:acyl phosphate:glycerol-3-phosphate acyltransferase
MGEPISFLVAALIGGYLLGSIPFGLVLTKFAGLGDIRTIGSGNIGATNVLRTGRKGLAAATLILDGAKGAVAALIAGLWSTDLALAAGYGAILGHLFPVWLRFKGGKGVATTLGTLLAIAWPIGIAACLTWAIVAAVFRYSSLSALLAVAFAPLYAWFLPPLWGAAGDARIVAFSAVLAVLVWIKHHSNIRRLLRGEEPRIGKRKAEAPG